MSDRSRKLPFQQAVGELQELSRRTRIGLLGGELAFDDQLKKLATRPGSPKADPDAFKDVT